MDEISALNQINFEQLILWLFIIIAAVVACGGLLMKFFEMIGVEFKWMRRRREDHELLIETSESLVALQKQHDESVKQSIKHDEKIEENLLKVSDALGKMSEQLDVIDNRSIRSETASRESLGDRISQKYRYYMQLEGIPEDELDEFVSLHDAYKGVGGNHSGDRKFEYCINNLKILPPSAKIDLEKANK